MSAPINNQFAGGYQINEKEKKLNEFWSAPDENFDPLKTLDGEEIKADGGGIYASFEEPKNDTNPLGEEIEEEENPDNILSILDNDDIDNIPEEKEVEIENESEIQENQWEVLTVNLEAFKEHPATPIFERYNATEAWYNLPQITENDCEKLLSNIWNNNTDLKSLEASCDIRFENPKAGANLKRYLSQAIKLNPEKTTESSEDWQVKLPEDFKSHELLSDSENDIVQLLAENYIKLPEWDNAQASFEADMQTCFETSANKLIEWKQFSRTETFEKAMKQISSGELESQLAAMNYIHKLVHTQEGQHGKKQAEKGKKLKDTQVANNNAVDAFQEAQSSKAKAEAELHANNQALEESTVLNAPEETWGDIDMLGGWEQDIMSKTA